MTEPNNENRSTRQNIIKGLQRLGFDFENYVTLNENDFRTLFNFKETVLKFFTI
jgi:hypothetical protein